MGPIYQNVKVFAVVRKRKNKSGENANMSCANAPPDLRLLIAFPHEWSHMSEDQLNMLAAVGDGAKQEKRRRVSNGNDI